MTTLEKQWFVRFLYCLAVCLWLPPLSVCCCFLQPVLKDDSIVWKTCQYLSRQLPITPWTSAYDGILTVVSGWLKYPLWDSCAQNSCWGKGLLMCAAEKLVFLRLEDVYLNCLVDYLLMWTAAFRIVLSPGGGSVWEIDCHILACDVHVCTLLRSCCFCFN